MRAKRLAAAFLTGLLVFSLVGCRLLPQIIPDGQKTTDESTGNTTQTEKSTDVTSRLVGTWENSYDSTFDKKGSAQTRQKLFDDSYKKQREERGGRHFTVQFKADKTGSVNVFGRTEPITWEIVSSNKTASRKADSSQEQTKSDPVTIKISSDDKAIPSTITLNGDTLTMTILKVDTQFKKVSTEYDSYHEIAEFPTKDQLPVTRDFYINTLEQEEFDKDYEVIDESFDTFIESIQKTDELNQPLIDSEYLKLTVTGTGVDFKGRMGYILSAENKTDSKMTFISSFADNNDTEMFMPGALAPHQTRTLFLYYGTDNNPKDYSGAQGHLAISIENNQKTYWYKIKF